MEEEFEDYLKRLKDRRTEDGYKYTDEDFEKFKLVKMLRKIGCNRTFAIELANKKYSENDFIKVILK